MERRDEILEKFTRYHKGMGTKEFRAEVEKLISEDSEMKDEFDDIRLLVEGFENDQIYNEARALFGRERKIIKFGRLRYIAAASIFLISVFSYLFLSTSFFPDLKLGDNVLMGNTKKDIQNTPQETAFDTFIAGKAYYESQDFEMAIKSFESVLQTENLRNQFREAVSWHLCVAYMRNEEFSEARELYDELIALEKPKYEVSLLSKWKISFQLFIKCKIYSNS